MNRKSLIGIRIFLLLTTYYLLHTPAHSYSLFSGAGLGEPVDRPGMFEFELPEDLAFECSLLSEIIDSDGKATNFKFTLPHFRYILPLPKGLAIELGLDELLNLDFDIQSGWQEFNGDSVEHRVKGKGSVSSFKIGVGKVCRGTGHRAPTLSVELGSFFVFGSSMEEWVTDFGDAGDVYDTVNLKFGGVGGMGAFRWRGERISLNAIYFSESGLTSVGEYRDTSLPSRFKVSLVCVPVVFDGGLITDMRIGAGITSWRWGSPYEPMFKFAFGSEIDVKSLTFRGGFYTGNWYYEGVEERVGSLGISIPFKSLLKVDLGFEFGKRWNSTIEEKIYRTCITLQGRESL